MARIVHLYRHTDNVGDSLSAEGIQAAVALGASLRGEYHVIASSGAQRATQTAGCILAGFGHRVPGGVVVVAPLRSSREDDWRAAYRVAGAGDLESLQSADPDLVRDDSAALARGLGDVFALLGDGERALAVGHSPTNEAAILGLTGVTVDPLGKGRGISITDTGNGYLVVPIG